MIRTYRNLLLLLVLGMVTPAFAADTSITISGAETQVSGAWDTGAITIAFGDSAGHSYNETVTYGQYSAPVSIASAFGGLFSNSYVRSGLCAYASGNSITFHLKGTATLGWPTVSNPSQSFSFNLAWPTISSVSPSSAAPRAIVTITGANFTSAQSGVTFNGRPATSIQVFSSTSIQAVVPAGATSGNVIVTANAVASNGVPLTVLPSPTITSLSPTSGSTGALVTINGANFGTTQGKVNFYGAVATSITSWSNTQIVVAVPSGASYGNVVVTTDGAPSNGVPFNVTTPIIWSLSSHNAGPLGPVGSLVTIEGQNFGTAQGTVTLNGVPATIGLWTCPSGCSSYSVISLIDFTVPAGATTGNVVVKTATGISSNGMLFTVTPPVPALSVTSNITPSAAGSPVTFTATISNGPSSGTISFYDGIVPIGTGTITGTTAQFTTSSLAAGDHAIIASYAGNSAYGAASPLYNPDTPEIYQYAYIQTVTGTVTLPAPGLINTIAGNGLSNTSTDGTGLQAYPGDSFAATSANLNGPAGIAVDSTGNVYVADTGNCSIREVLTTSTVENIYRAGTYAAGDITNVAGASSSASCGSEGGGTSWPAIDATLYWPTGVGLDTSGNVYIADTNNDSVREVTINVPSISPSLPTYVTIASNNNQQIPGYSGDGGLATSALLNGPSGVVVDASGNVYIADTSNNVIRKINLQGIISTVVGTSTQGYSGDGGPAASANLSWPVGMAVDQTGNLYIADMGNNVIRKVSAPVTSTSTISTVVGNSNEGYSGDDGPATGAELSEPSGIAVDSSGNLYIADSDNDVIRKVTAATGIISTIAGNGTAGFSGDGGVATNAELDSPSGVAVDAAGNIYISDTQNQRIRVVGASKTVPSITWAQPSAINYGTVLTNGSAPLNATAESIAGTYAYAIASSTLQSTAASGYMPKVGTYTLSVTFTPTDAAHYSTATASVTVTVNQIPTPIVWAAPASITDSTPLSATQLNATSNAAGTFVYSPAAGAVLKPGPQLLTVTLTPTDTTDYFPNTTTVSINVAPGGTSDTGLVTLTVAGNTIASTTYGSGATPTTVAQGLASGVVGGAPVRVTAVGNAVYIEATGAGSSTNYPYSLQTVSYDSQDFSQPSFFSQPIDGTLEGGADSQPTGTSTVVYSYQVPAGDYDGDSNVLGYVDSVMGAWNFSYDTLNRLSTATATANMPAPFAGEYGCWSYDAFGNRLTQSMSTTPCTSNPPFTSWANYTIDGTPNTADNGKNQIKGTQNGIYRYDPAGNVLNDGQNEYLYDGAGRICAEASTPIPGITIVTGYLYDADGQRVAKGRISSWSCNPAVNGFQTLSDYILGPGGEQMTEMGIDASAGSPTTNLVWKHTNVWAGGNLIATYDNDGLHFYLNDPLGTRRVQTDYAGVIEQTCQGLPYGDGLNCMSASKGTNGTVYAGSLSGPTEHHYTGKERDAESGLDHFDARYYGSSMGRMLSPDPGNMGVDRTNPQSWNMYSYSLNNPLAFTDPTGMYVCEDSTNCDSTNDQNFAKALASAQTAVSNMAAGTDRDSAQRAIDAYGAQGVDNGVNVRFDANISESGGVTEVSGIANGNKSADNPTGQNINVTFKPDAINTDWSGGLAAHEGAHVADASDWVGSGFSANMNPTSNATELRAYQVQFNVMNGIGNNLYGPNGTFSANMQYGNARVDWKKGDSFKLPEFQILIKTENGKRDSKPAFTAGKGAAIQP